MPVTKSGQFTDFDEEGSLSEESTGSSQESSLDDIDRDSSRSVASSDNGNAVLGLDKGEAFVILAIRILFFIFLLSSAAVLGWMVYLSARNDQVEDFEVQFQDEALEVLDLSDEHVRKIMEILTTVSTTMTSFIRYNKELGIGIEYPAGFLTLPDVEEQFLAARNATNALLLAYSPVVTADNVDSWNAYADANQEWIAQSNNVERTEPIEPLSSLTDNGSFAPIWTMSSPPQPENTGVINDDLLEREAFAAGLKFVDESSLKPILLDIGDQASWFDKINYADILQTSVVVPVFEDFDRSSQIVGHLTAVISWVSLFETILGESVEENPILVIIENTCDQVFTMELRGKNAEILSVGADVHNTKYDRLSFSQPFADFSNPSDGAENNDYCAYTIRAYPTEELENYYKNGQALLLTIVVFGVFLTTSMFFLVFDCLVHRRQDRVINVALKQNAIVSSLFPKAIQDKMLAEVDDTNNLTSLGKAGLKSYLRDAKVAADTNETKVDKSKPIADLFPETTIMFADIAGFTAWSSVREPSMVFTLLETVYHFFDTVSKKRRVFKVEVVGDCYVAVCGLPDPRKDHAVVMAKYAYEILRGMGDLTAELETSLGPETTELGLRVGLHSGPVVAGVLRGDKSRFQLFGDTMNTASRMESTGVPNRIQVSQETAELLIAARKGHWIVPREDKVQAKGKGSLTTYWLQPSGGSNPGTRSSGVFSDNLSIDSSGRGSVSSDMSFEDYQMRQEDVATRHRIAEWTVEVLACLLKEIQARRETPRLQKNWEKLGERKKRKKGSTVIDEVEEIIMLPEYTAKNAKEADAQTLDVKAFEELRQYVRTIASMYNRNHFHNFAHANHVTMSVTKLLSRIVAPDVEQLEGVNQKSLHDHTYGITSDPLTRFAVVLSALIHDVDHTGVSNMQLVKERNPIAEFYHGKSVAEQNSVDLAWNLLMEPSYENLRKAIYTNEAEFLRFRQLVVNTVMATDIMDKDLKKLRNDRWDKAFSIPPEEERRNPRAVNRKATIVIEHLIQASDVAHTMQHWHIYRKWNERLFREMYKAYEEGRMEKDPSTDWYKGELGFFDFYIIPLAKKLKECGVFGVSSYEYLSYAQQNRKEWKERGEEIVAEMVVNARRKNIGDIFFAMQQDSVDPDGQKFVKEVLDDSKRQARRTSGKGTMKPPTQISTRQVLDANGSNKSLLHDSSINELDDDDELDVDFDIPIKE